MNGLSAIAQSGEKEALKKVNEPRSEYGKTVGEPKLSEEGKKYYEELKKKYGNYDFVLVSSDQKENAKANASKYANSFKTVVLIDEEKIERMATDKEYRQKYENILSGATAQLEQLKQSVQTSGANVKGFGMQVNDDGTASFFAVLKKSSADQKARIKEKAVEKKEAKRAEEKKAAKEAAKERAAAKLSEKHSKKAADAHAEASENAAGTDGKNQESNYDSAVTLSASSVEELLTKIQDFAFAQRSDSVLTKSEMAIGQNIDFRG